MTINLNNLSPDDHLPPALRAALRQSIPSSPSIPPDLDASILHLAHARFAQRRRLIRYSLFAATAAAAASLLLVFSLNRFTPSAPGPTPIAINTAHPTILDAFALARELRDHPQLVQKTPVYHITHRPTVDQRDIDALAAAAVALAPFPPKPEALQ